MENSKSDKRGGPRGDLRAYCNGLNPTEEKGCHICGGAGHFWKSCRFYNDKYTLEQNQRWFKKKHKDDSTDDHKATEGGPRGGASSAGAGGATVKKGAANNVKICTVG